MSNCDNSTRMGLIILVMTLPSLLVAQEPFPNAPPLLKEQVKKAATDIASGHQEVRSGLDQNWLNIIGYVVLDAKSQAVADAKERVVAAKQQSLRDIGVFPYLGETRRTDKQTSASATANGSTSAAEKPGIPLFLSYAIEHGAIQNSVSGDTMTLSGSPYALISLVTRQQDTPSNFARYKNWRRLGYSVSFNLNNTQPPPGGSTQPITPTSILGNLQPKQITEFSIRARLTGERTTRTEKFMKFWREKIKPIQEEQDEVLTKIDFQALSQNHSFTRATDQVQEDLVKSIKAYLNQPEAATASPDAKEAQIENLILKAVKEGIFDKVSEGTLPDPLTNIQRENTVKRLADVRKKFDIAASDLQHEIDRINKSRLLAFEYTNHRNMMISGYSELKLLYEDHVVALNPLEFDLIFNAGASLYNSPNPALRQSTLRDFSATLSAEGTANNPFRPPDGKDLSKVTYSFSGRYEHLKETRSDIAVAQFKVELPISMGMSIPFSVTYANRTEFIKEKEIRGNFGFGFDLDKLYALTRKGLNP